MLERQIKAAFELAADGEEVLTYPALDSFLVNLGCLGPSRSTDGEIMGSERALEVSRRVRVALWRHLDPHKDGYVDLLTLTVFFHVLMGAVDDPAQAAAPHQDENTSGIHTNAINRFPGAEGPDSHASLSLGAPDSAGTLESIIEEQGELEESETAIRRAEQSLDPEICELVNRFDPVKLRAEFRQLYLNRLHFQASRPENNAKSKSSSADVPQAQPSQRNAGRSPARAVPEINDRSRGISDRLCERQVAQTGGTINNHVELLYWRQNQVNSRLEEQRKKQSDDEVRKCTFRPDCSPTAHRSHVVENSSPTSSSGSNSKHDTLYSQAVTRQRKRESQCMNQQHRDIAKEMAACTFRPNIARSSRSYKDSARGYPSPPKGFDECTTRLRRATAAQEVRRRDAERSEPIIANPAASLRGAAPGVRKEEPARARRPQGASTPQDSVGTFIREGSAKPPNQNVDRLPLRSQVEPSGSQSSVRSSSHPRPQHTEASVHSRSPRPASPLEISQDRETVAPDSGSKRLPVLYVDVNIAPGRPPERLVLHKGQTPADAAADFAARHGLSMVLAQKLHTLLTQQVAAGLASGGYGV